MPVAGEGHGAGPGEPLALHLQATLAPLLAARWTHADAPESTLSDPWFANLLLFRQAHDWRWLPGRYPCISGHAYDGERLLLPLFDLAAAPVATLRDRLQGHAAFGPLSDAQAARLNPADWHLSSRRDDADYVYDADRFRDYRGTVLHKKRNLVKQLLAAHRVQAIPYTEALADEAATVLQTWLADKAKAPGQTDDGPCLQALAEAGRLGLDGWLHRVDGQAAGFLLAERIRPGVAVMRFAKAADRYKGLYQHMFQQYAQADPGLRWLNFEQDLGLANFRQTKLSYQPVALLNKHRATPRPL
jgi:hypothetical protein